MSPRLRSLPALACALAPFLLPSASLAAAAPAAPPAADLVVYGATAAGIMTAYAAAREGLHVTLLEPGSHIGGMVTGGLSATDLGHFTIIGGYARDFYTEVAAHYGLHDLSTAGNWRSEPHVDVAVFEHLLRTPGITLHLHERLQEHTGVRRSGLHLQEIVTEDGRHWPGKVFADCTYEGDLMAQSKVTYTVGRESTEVYNEDLAGVRDDTPKHQFLWKLSAFDDEHHLLPEIDPGPLAPNGSGDKKVQTYNFRLILTDDPGNRLPWTKPAGYNVADFALFARYLQQFQANRGRPPVLHDVMNPVAIPNHKADFNNNGPFSTDYIGKSWTYPDASYAERDRIWQAHLLYTESFLWFLSQDPRVPSSLRDEANQWGRARDEFADTGHWPNQLYVREGRRLLGQYVMKQADLQTDRTKPDSIAMGSYNSDSHNIQRVSMPDGSVRNEGDVQVPVEPYEISFRSILPKPTETDNLLVPVCLSASHVAYSSVRMEPQYMMIGQAAGTAAALAVHTGAPVGAISVPDLQAHLRKAGAILHFDEQASSPATLPASH